MNNVEIFFANLKFQMIAPGRNISVNDVYTAIVCLVNQPQVNHNLYVADTDDNFIVFKRLTS